MLTNLADGVSTSSQAGCMYISGTDVYIGGSVLDAGDPTGYIAAYWKNGTVTRFAKTPISTGIISEGISSIFVSGSDVYATGYSFNGFSQYCRYWENGVYKPIGTGSNPNEISGTLNSVFVVN